MRRRVRTVALLVALSSSAFAGDDGPRPVSAFAAERARLLVSPHGAEKTSELIRLMLDHVRWDSQVFRACDAAEDLGAPAVEALLRLVAPDEDPRIQGTALRALWKVHPRVIRSDTGRRAMAAALDWIAVAPDHEKARREGLGGVRSLFEKAGPAALEFLPRLRELTRDDSPFTRRAAVECLTALRRFAGAPRAEFQRAAQDADVGVRRAGMRGLFFLNLHDEQSRKIASGAGDDADAEVRKFARFVTGSPMSRTLREDDAPPLRYPELQDGIVYWSVGPADEPAKSGPTLPPGEDDGSGPRVPSDAETRELSVAELSQLLLDRDLSVWAADELARRGPDARDALPALLRCTEHPYAARGPIIRALAAIGGGDAEVVTELIALLEGIAPTRSMTHTNTEPIEAHAAQALGRLGARATAALPALKLAATSTRRELRQSARKAIADIASAD